MPALRSVNKVILVGNLTRDAEVNFTAGGTAVCVFTVATNRAWKGTDGDFQEEASFHRVNAWGKYGENLGKILKKGQKVYVEGFLTYREQRDEAGKLTGKDARIRAESVILLDRADRQSSEEEFSGAQGDTASHGSDAFDLDEIAKDMDEAKGSAAPKAKAKPVADDDLPF